MSNLPMIWMLGDERAKWFCDIKPLLQDEFTIASVHSDIVLKKLLESPEPYGEISPIVLIDNKVNHGKGIDVARKIQEKYLDAQVILIIRADEPIPELQPYDTFELAEIPLRPETLAAKIRLDARKTRTSAIRESWIEASNFLMESEDKNKILSKIVELAPSIVAKSSKSSVKPFSHFAQLKFDNGKRVLKFHKEHHNPEVWNMLRQYKGGKILLPETDEIEARSATSNPIQNSESERIGIVGRAVQEKKPQRANDVNDDQWKPFYIPLDPAIHSQLAIPIFVNNEIYGVINLEHPDKGAFDKGDEQALEALSKLIALAVKKADAAEHLKKSEIRFKALYDAIRAIMSSSLDSKATHDQILKQALKIVGCTPNIDTSFANIRQLDEGVLSLVAIDPPELRRRVEAHNLLDMQRYSKKGTIGITVRAAREAMPQLIFDVTKDPDYIPLSDAIKAQLSVPLNDSADHVVGVLTIELADPRVFTDNAVEAIKLLAQVAGLAFESAHVLGKVKQELTDRLDSLKVDHDNARQQSNWLSWASLGMAVLSTFVLFCYLLTALLLNRDIGGFSIIAAAISPILGYWFFARVDTANSRLDNYYNSRLARISGFKMLLNECTKLPADKQADLICHVIDEYSAYLRSLDRLTEDKPKPSDQLIEDKPKPSDQLIEDKPKPSDQLTEDKPKPS